VKGGVAVGSLFEHIVGWLRELAKLRDIFASDPATAQLLTALR